MRVLRWTPLLVAFGACQIGDAETSTTEQPVVTTVDPQNRMIDMTVYATQNHSSGDCFCTSHNATQHGGHPTACTGHRRHGGQWVMRWQAYCEREDAGTCINSYPVVTGGTRTETSTWKGANEHWHWFDLDWNSCAKWTWGSNWEGANYCEGRSQGEVAASEGSGAPNVFVAAGVGYGMRHGEDEAILAPSVVIGAGNQGIGVGAGAGLEFSYTNVNWGNGYEIKCQYRCRWHPAQEEVALEEMCWAVGWDNSDENPTGAGAHHQEMGPLQLDGTWRDLRRQRCTTDDDPVKSFDGGSFISIDAGGPQDADVPEPPDAAEPMDAPIWTAPDAASSGWDAL